MVSILRLAEKRSGGGQDNFFLWSIVILPILAQGAYIFDAFYYLTHHADDNGYEGLLSTILIVFAYLRYCSPIESRLALFIYYIALCLLSEAGTIGYVITFIIKKDVFFIIVYCFWAFIELVMTIMLIYCRIVMRYEINFIVENKHLFHFMSRLEIILAIFIPFFTSVWIKSTLYIFVATVTTAVAAEWLYFARKDHFYEQISAVSELISACLCNLLIILQFFPYHFTPVHIAKIAREGFLFQQRLSMNLMNKNEDQHIDIQKPEKTDPPPDSAC